MGNKKRNNDNNARKTGALLRKRLTVARLHDFQWNFGSVGQKFESKDQKLHAYIIFSILMCLSCVPYDVNIL